MQYKIVAGIKVPSIKVWRVLYFIVIILLLVWIGFCIIRDLIMGWSTM